MSANKHIDNNSLTTVDIHCPEIFHGIYIEPSGAEKINISPCCQSRTTSISNTQFNFEKSIYLNKLRKENCSNIKSPECDRCWDSEDSNHQSKRQSANIFHKTADTNIELNTIEYNTTWACNLACIMCDPKNSSTLANELGLSKFNNHDNISRKLNDIISHLDLSNIHRIHFNGGEPLINSNHVNLLKQVSNLSKCKLSYNTNGTKLPNKETLDYWKKSKMVRIFFSIDAVGDAFEYIRWNANWEKVRKNIAWFVKHCPSNVMFGINVTVGAYNVLEILDLYRWFNEELKTNREGDESDFNWQLAYNFNFSWLPVNIKMEAIEMLSNDDKLTSLRNALLSSLNATPNSKWIDKLEVIDKRRNINWKKSLKVGKFYQ